MMFLKFFLLYILHLIQSQTICLNNTIITCYCTHGEGAVTCLENLPSNETFIDWSLSSIEHERFSFNFINFTRLTPYTFTNFSSRFPSLTNIEFYFRYGIDKITENTFQFLNYYPSTRIHLTFNLPRNFQLADNAFGQLKYNEITISNIHNLPYQFNLRAFHNTNISHISITDSKQIDFISNQSSLSLKWSEVIFTNCSIENADLLTESLSSEFLTTLDLSFNRLIQIPHLIKLTKLTSINFQNNLIEEIRSNIFSHLIHVYQIDLSHNYIKHISPNAFIGLTTLTTLRLNDNYLNSLETLTTHNELTSFLYPLNQTLNTLDLSKNFLHDFKPLQNLSSLKILGLSYNQIKHLDEYAFKKAQKIQSIDLSSNHIESIHPLAFNGTLIEYLDLSSNLFSSLETTKIIYDQQFQPKNQTTSFLDSIASTLTTLSLANCTNLLEINWFVFTKLNSLTKLDLSRIPKSDKFWYLQSRYENSSAIIHWNHHLPSLKINFNSIQFNNYDYCLSKSIFQIFNRTRLFLDDDHPCNCFIFMLKQKLDSETYPSCLLNQSTIDQLAQECINIDFTCFSLTSSTIQSSASSSSSTSSSSLTSISTSTTRITESSLSTSFSSMISSSTLTVTESISSLTTLITTTKILTTLGTRKDDGKWKIVLAIMIPLTVIIIILSLAGIYIVKRQKNKNFKETIEMDGSFVNIFARK